MTPVRRVLVICNPTAGGFRGRLFPAVLAELDRRGCHVVVKQTAKRGDGEAFARSVCDGAFDAVVAAGGDGTITEVATGLLGRQIPLGIIPLGTANVLAAEIGLVSTAEGLCAAIVGGNRVSCYPGTANGRVFLMMCSVGFDAHVVENVSLRLKKAIGKGAYVLASLRQLLRADVGLYEVHWQGQSRSAASVIVGKGHFYGGRYVVTPAARINQPHFQVCLLLKSGRLATLRYIIAMLMGTLDRRDDTFLFETDSLTVTGPSSDPVQGDGDLIASLPLDVAINANTLDLLVPG